jgi:hypothetical protein
MTFSNHYPGFGNDVFTSLSPGLSISSSSGEHPTRCQWTGCSNGGIHLSWHAREQVSVTQRNPKKAQKSIGSPTYQTGKNLAQIIDLHFGGRRGA